MSEQTKAQFPTEMIDLPSKGKLYPKEHPFSSGKVEMRYMTAKEEDILTSQSLLRKGLAFERVLENLIVEKVDLDTVLLGDKNALMIASRVLGYGKDYKITVTDPNDSDIKEEVNIDLSNLDDREIDFSRFIKGTREFTVELPLSKRNVTAKVLTSGDDKAIDIELKGLKKLEKTTGVLPEMTTRIKYAITSIDGNDKKESIRNFVDTEMLAGDSSFLRDEIYEMTPDLDMTFAYESSNGEIEDLDIPIDISFFFPNRRR
jgi:hypothetical protein